MRGREREEEGRRNENLVRNPNLIETETGMDLQDPKDRPQSNLEKVPREIFFNIFSRLPLKSVIRSSCVSKFWLNMIKDPFFAKLYISRRSETDSYPLILKHRVLKGKNIIGISPIRYKASCLSADETAIDHMVSSLSWNLVGACDGLLCFTSFGEEEVTMICNPVTREHIILPKPAIPTSSYLEVQLVFGFDPVSEKYKVVRVLSCKSSVSHSVPQRVERVPAIPGNDAGVHADLGNQAALNANHGAGFHAVVHHRHRAGRDNTVSAEAYTMGTDSWREVQGFNSCSPHGKSVYSNGVVYWLASPPNLAGRILSFDLGSEQFKLIPHRRFGTQINLAELGGCLAVVDISSRANVEISVLKDPSGLCWELAYIIPLDKFGQQRRWRPPTLICLQEMENGLLIWLEDAVLLYNKKTFVKKHLKISGFPTWLDWKICSGYRAGLVPLGKPCGTGDGQRGDIRFISDSELHAYLLRSDVLLGPKTDRWCDGVVASFEQNGMLI